MDERREPVPGCPEQRRDAPRLAERYAAQMARSKRPDGRRRRRTRRLGAVRGGLLALVLLGLCLGLAAAVWLWKG